MSTTGANFTRASTRRDEWRIAASTSHTLGRHDVVQASRQSWAPRLSRLPLSPRLARRLVADAPNSEADELADFLMRYPDLSHGDLPLAAIVQDAENEAHSRRLVRHPERDVPWERGGGSCRNQTNRQFLNIADEMHELSPKVGRIVATLPSYERYTIDRWLELQNRQLEVKDRQLEMKDRQLEDVNFKLSQLELKLSEAVHRLSQFEAGCVQQPVGIVPSHAPPVSQHAGNSADAQPGSEAAPPAYQFIYTDPHARERGGDAMSTATRRSQSSIRSLKEQVRERAKRGIYKMFGRKQSEH